MSYGRLYPKTYTLTEYPVPAIREYCDTVPTDTILIEVYADEASGKEVIIIASAPGMSPVYFIPADTELAYDVVDRDEQPYLFNAFCKLINNYANLA